MLDVMIGAVRASLVTFVLCGLLYPLALTALGQWILPFQANGSLERGQDGAILGSRLIGQQWTGPEWFHGRLSATTTPDPNDPSKTVPAPYNAASSAGSNLGPTSKSLLERLERSRDAGSVPTRARRQVAARRHAHHVGFWPGSGHKPGQRHLAGRSCGERPRCSRNANPFIGGATRDRPQSRHLWRASGQRPRFEPRATARLPVEGGMPEAARRGLQKLVRQRVGTLTPGAPTRVQDCLPHLISINLEPAMSPLTIFLSRLIGLFAVLVSLSLLVAKKSGVEAVAALIHDRPLMLTFGMIVLIGGLAMVLNWPPFRPDTRHNLEGLRLSSSTGLCLTTTNGSN